MTLFRQTKVWWISLFDHQTENIKLSQFHKLKTTLWHSCNEINTNTHPHTHIPSLKLQWLEWCHPSSAVCMCACVHYVTITAGCLSDKDNTLKQKKWQGALLHTTSSAVVRMKTDTCCLYVASCLILLHLFQQLLGPITSLYFICHFENKKVLSSQSTALGDLYVSLPFPLPSWESLCTMASSSVNLSALTRTHKQYNGSSPVQWVSPADQYDHWVSMISSSSRLTVWEEGGCREKEREHRKGEMEVRWREGDSSASGGPERCFYHQSEIHTLMHIVELRHCPWHWVR